MITTFARDEDGDIFIGKDGNVAMLEGLPAVMELCASAVKTILGEMVLNVNQGMPNFQVVWKPGMPNIPQFQAALRNTLSQVPGVTNVQDIQTSVSKGVLSYTAVIVNIYGSGVLSGNV